MACMRMSANGDVRRMHLCVRAGEPVAACARSHLESYRPAAVSVYFRQRKRDSVRNRCILFALRPRTRVARARLRQRTDARLMHQ